MTRFATLATAFTVALASPASAQKTETLSLRVEGKTRSAIIHVPAGIKNPPVVFFVHGAGGKGFWSWTPGIRSNGTGST